MEKISKLAKVIAKEARKVTKKAEQIKMSIEDKIEWLYNSYIRNSSSIDMDDVEFLVENKEMVKKLIDDEDFLEFIEEKLEEKGKTEEEYLDSFDYLYSLLVNGNISQYKERLSNMTTREIVQYINWAEEMGIGKEKLKLNYIESSKKQRFSKKAIKLNPVYFESNGNSKIQDELKVIDDLRKQIVEESNIREIKNIAQLIITAVDEYKKLIAEKNNKK